MWLTSTAPLKPKSSAFKLDTSLLAAMTFSLANLRTNLQMMAFGLLKATRDGTRCAVSISFKDTTPNQRIDSHRVRLFVEMFHVRLQLAHPRF